MLYLMRHGKTEWNARRKLQGRTDIPLNEEGRQMAKEAAIEYKDVNFDICFCSPLVRARETAELVLEGRDIPIIIDDRLAEMGFGIYEGIENCFDLLDCPVRVLFFEPQNYKGVEGGETLEEVFKRTGEVLKERIEPELAKGKDVLIIGHGAMNSCILTQVKNKPIKDLWSDGIKNCKLMKIKD